LKDSKALPCPDDGEVFLLWFMIDGLERSAKLEGSLVGEVGHSVGNAVITILLLIADLMDLSLGYIIGA